MEPDSGKNGCLVPFHEKYYGVIMKKLVAQIMKFGVVGFICFFIDLLTGMATLNVLQYVFGVQDVVSAMAGSALGFTVSVIVNYLLSFKYVFQRKENMNRKAEFVVFVILSVIGLGVNQLVMWVCVGPVYRNIALLQQLLDYNLMYTAAKVVATAIVMVYNFVSRKMFLEQKE